MKLVIYSAVVFCLMCHHHLFHRHAHACGGVQAVAVQSFAVAQPCYAQSFAVAAPVYAQSFAVAQPVYAQAAFAAPVCSSFAVGGGHGRSRSVSRSFSRSVSRN